MPNDRQLNLCAPIEQWVEAGAADAGDAPALRRFSMTAYTGGAMVLAGWPHPVVVDLAGLEVAGGGLKSRPILKDHNRSLIVGHTDSIRVEGSQLLVSGVVSGAGPVAREIVESSRNGFPWQASLGAIGRQMELVPRGKKALVNGREFEGPVHIARRSVLGEVSFVALGADDNTSAAVAASAPEAPVKEDAMTFEQWLEAKGFDRASLTDTQSTSLRAMFDAEQAAAPGQEDQPGAGDDTDVDGKTPDSLGIVGKRSVMLVALRLLHYLGFGTVYLLGCDFKMAPDRKYAFEEHRAPNAIRHNNVLYDSLARRFEALRPHFEKHRFRVINCSPGSELRAFERMDYEKAVAAASAECGKRVRTEGWYEPNPEPAKPPAQEAAR